MFGTFAERVQDSPRVEERRMRAEERSEEVT
jgi:hypothetical protein